MTAEEKAALEWLRVAFAAEGTSRCHWFPDANDMKQAATLKAMLAQPRLPEPIVGDPDFEDALKVMRDNEKRINAWNAYRALYAHLTKPKTKTKTVEVWRIEFAKKHHVTGYWLAESATCPDREHLEREAEWMREHDCYACIRVTGPHTQEVPT